MQYCLNQDPWVATCLSSMIDEEQLQKNFKSATTSIEYPEMIEDVKKVFEDCPVTHWENLETEKYWKEMYDNGWHQNLN